jgi:hypothetical protein
MRTFLTTKKTILTPTPSSKSKLLKTMTKMKRTTSTK